MNEEKNIQNLPENERVKKRYGLFTATTMVVGIVIGSGIFFKSDNILVATGGSVLLGVILFCFAAIAIIFGSLSIAELASRTSKPGGLMNYADAFLSPAAGSAYGWFQTFVYMPTITCVLAWVSGIYTCQLFGIEPALETAIGIGTCWMLFFFAMNIISASASGWFQNAATVIKIIPLIIIGFAGISSGSFAQTFQPVSTASASSWLLAIPAVAFSFDGWIIATSIAHEVRDSRKNLPRALIMSPLIILVLYILYFVGICALIGPDQVITMGDAHLAYAANLIFGPVGEKVIGVIIVISVVGGLNGLTMGMSQMPYSLAIRNMIPFSKHLSKTSEKSHFPIHSVIASIVITMLWMVVHYLTQKFTVLYNSDVSEIAIVVSYLLYLPLYWKVFQLGRDKIIGPFRGIVCPIFAAVGSVIIFCGGLQSALFIYYMIFCMIFLYFGWRYYKKVTDRIPQ